MKALTNEQLKAIETLKELAGDEFRTICFTKLYTEVPKEWFMATFSPEDSDKELLVENPDKDELHVMRAGWNGMVVEAVLYGEDYEQWVKAWEGQTNE